MLKILRGGSFHGLDGELVLLVLIEAILLWYVLNRANGVAQFMQNAVINIVNPAVNTEFLPARPRILHYVRAGNIVDLVQHIKLAQTI